MARLVRSIKRGAGFTRLLAGYLAVVLTIAVAGPGMAVFATGEGDASVPEVLEASLGASESGPESADPEESGPTPEPEPEIVVPAAGEAPPAPIVRSAAAVAPVAPAAFVDSTDKASRDFRQFANKLGSEQWIGGIVNQQKADYSEGMSVPQRLVLRGVASTGSSHYVEFKHQYTKQGKYAYDFITSWDQAVSAANRIGGQTWPQSWKWMGMDPPIVDSLDDHYVDVPIPGNGHATARENAYTGALGYGGRTLRVYSSQPITNVRVTVDRPIEGSTSGDSFLYFKVSWDGVADRVMILYAAHVAVGLDPSLPPSGIGWGAGMGASAISGGPYHNMLSQSTEWRGTPSEDNQLMASAVKVMSGITGMKFNDLDGDGVYPPETGESGIGGWQIWADLNNDGDFDAGIDPTVTTNADGTYGLYFYLPNQQATSVRVYETPQAGWRQTYPKSLHHVVPVALAAVTAGVDFGNHLNLKPEVQITKTASARAVPETGADVTFTFDIENTGPVDFAVTSLTDSVFGSLMSVAQAAWLAEGRALPIRVPVGGSWSFTYTRTLASDARLPHTNTVTVVVADGDGDTASDSDDETVTFTDVAPVITVTKTATPRHIPEGGAYVTFTVRVSNPGPEDVTLTTLTDSVYGDLSTLANSTAVLPQTILIGGSYQATFTVALSSDDLADHYNVVTAEAVDDEGTKARATDDETVTFEDTPPEISVTKTASPTSVPETGGWVTFTITVTNTGDEAVTLTDAYDDTFAGWFATLADFDTTGLAVGEVATATFTEWLEADDLVDHENVVTVTAVDNDGSTDSDSDDETVTFTDVAPVITVTKTATPRHIPEGGAYVTFTVRVSNPGPEDVTLTTLTDSVYGDLSTLANSTAVLPQTILIGGSYQATFTVALSSDDLADHYNVVTAEAVDDEGTKARATDDETVTFEDTPPEISVTKTASPTSVPETGGWVTFTITVTNTGDEAVTLTDAYDDTFAGWFATLADFDTTGLAVGEVATATFTEWLEADDLVDHENVVTVTAVDNDQTVVDDDAAAVVTFEDVLPSLTVAKTAEPAWMIMPGGTFTYTAAVTNTSAERVQILSVSDDVAGTIYAWDVEGPEVWLALDETREFTFTSDHTAPGVFTNTVTAVVADNEGNEASAMDSAQVVVTDPAISVVKSSNAPEKGIELGKPTLVTYTYVVKNIGDVPLFDVEVRDDQLGVIGTIDELAVDQTVTMTKSVTLTDGVTNVVTVTGYDEHENLVSDEDSVTIDSYLPFTEVDLGIVKVADRATAEPGDVITYTLTFRNYGVTPASGFTIVDDFDERYLSIVDAAGGTVAGGKITWNISGPLASSDGSRSITYRLRVADSVPLGRVNVDNIARVSHPADANPANDVDDARVVVSEPFLPFTGGDAALLLGAAMAAATLGAMIRRRERGVTK